MTQDIQVSTTDIKELRAKTAAGVMACRCALVEAQGNMEKAAEILRRQGLAKAEKKAERTANQGLVETYVHHGGRIGVIVEVNCETDFVAHTDEFKALAHDIAMQVAAISPLYISAEGIPQGSDVDPKQVCLLLQPFIKAPEKTIQDLVTETIAKLGENIKVKRFVRFELGCS